MLELLLGIGKAVLMVPVIIAIMLCLIYGLGEIFNIISTLGHGKDQPAKDRQ